MKDISFRENFILLPLAVLVILLGIFPNYILDRITPSVERVIVLYERGLDTSMVQEKNGI